MQATLTCVVAAIGLDAASHGSYDDNQGAARDSCHR